MALEGPARYLTPQQHMAVIQKTFVAKLYHLESMYGHCGINASLAVPGKVLLPRRVSDITLPFGTQIDSDSYTSGDADTSPVLPSVRVANLKRSESLRLLSIVPDDLLSKENTALCVYMAVTRALRKDLDQVARDSQGRAMLECDALTEEALLRTLLQRTLAGSKALPHYKKQSVLELLSVICRANIQVYRLCSEAEQQKQRQKQPKRKQTKKEKQLHQRQGTPVLETFIELHRTVKFNELDWKASKMKLPVAGTRADGTEQLPTDSVEMDVTGDDQAGMRMAGDDSSSEEEAALRRVRAAQVMRSKRRQQRRNRPLFEPEEALLSTKFDFDGTSL